MGADIHMYVEKKKDGEWKGVLGPDPYADFKNEGFVDWVDSWIYKGRNYELFALLADVRNDGSIEPIENPRNLPEDITDFVNRHAENWEADGHSHSYFYLSDLLTIEEKTWIEIDDWFYENVIGKLRLLEGEVKDSVRIVFWFDN